MRPARAFFTTAMLTTISLLATTNCGDDEATGPNAGGAGGGIINGDANGGTGGGTAGSSGSGGSSGAPAGSRIGQACVNDTECDPTGMTGLTCLPPDSTELEGGGGPPRGLCTLECSTHDTCFQVDGNSLCVSFGGTGYCIEGCTQGPPDPLAPPKCHNRLQFACTPLEPIQSDTACTSSTECPEDEQCFQNTCVFVPTVCLPACTGDQDCGSDLFCDRQTGNCVAEPTAGEPLGTACDPAAATDPCTGFCQTVSDVPNLEGMCGEICNFFNPCAWEGDEPAGLCIYSTVINEDPDTGDFGFCAPMCNCSAQCVTPGFGCVAVEGLDAAFGFAGVCVYPFGEDGGMVETITQCAGGGSGGTGGTGGTGPGAGGEAGAN